MTRLTFLEFSQLSEAVYNGNIGIMELAKFYSKAPPETVKEFKTTLASGNQKDAWDIVEKFLDIKMHSSIIGKGK